jgi:predicted RNA binding protein YcfA (HicA-like mRNA interferase family)
MPTKVREAIRRIEDDGWFQVKSGGSSHRQYKHPTKSGRVTIAGKLSDDLAPDTLKSILNEHAPIPHHHRRSRAELFGVLAGSS